ncbi:MAG: formylmethanofuran dehydrogenase subunit B [Planctomycetota bacterium]
MDESVPAPSQTFHQIACTRCGCVCDDLSVEVSADGGISGISTRCHLAVEFYESLRKPFSEYCPQINGVDVAFEEAVQEAARLLQNARSPLLFGLSRSSTDGQRAACELADLTSGTIDTTASVGHGASIMALQAAGESTSTLGEVRHRSDLVIYWACDPMESHPRHVERFVDAVGMDVPNGRSDRYVVLVNSSVVPKQTSFADQVIQLTPGSDFELFWTLRLILRGQNLHESTVAGVPVSELIRLVDRMKNCRYGVIFFGVQLTEGRVGHANVEALLRLVTDLNLQTRFVARRMRIPGDVTGADSVLCWQTGYPFSVSLSRGYPRYHPGEYSAGTLLERGETDCVVLIGGERVHKFTERARQHLARVPVIHLDPPRECYGVLSAVRFYTAIDGIHRNGTVYRMDEVPVPLRKLANSFLPSDEEVLKAISQIIRKRQSGEETVVSGL